MEWSLKINTEPTSEPVSVIEAKEHLRITHSDEDSYISRLITMARQWSETFTNRAFITQTWDLKLQCFPSVILLPRSPAISHASNAVTYVDTAGTSQTLSTSTYTIDYNQEPATVRPAYQQSWPAIRSQESPLPVTVTYQAGYGAATAVPAGIKQAIFAIVATSYEFREDAATSPVMRVDLASERLLWPYRVWQEYVWR